MAAATSGPSSNAASLADLRDLAISDEPDRYFAATLAPAVLRYDLIVLAAFAAEIARVPGQVREPLAGEIRLQWWRDALIGGSSEAAAGHPVATAMRATMRRFGLPAEVVVGVIDAQADVFHGERPVDEKALRARLAASEGGLFRLAAHICAAGSQDAQTANLAGFTYGLSRALLPARDDEVAPSLIPRSILADANFAHGGAEERSTFRALIDLAHAAHADVAARMRQMSRRQRLAYLPLAMVKPNLHALEREYGQEYSRSNDAPRIARLLRIGWAHVSGRI